MNLGRGPKQLGMTLVEVLIAMTVLSLMMTMVVTGIVSALRNGARMSDQLLMVRQATTGADCLERELRMCQQVYVPDPDSGAWPESAPSPAVPSLYNPIANADPTVPGSPYSPFVFVHPSYPSGGSGEYELVVVGYRWNSQTGVLQRLEYDPGYDPGPAASGTRFPLNGGTWQLVCSNVTGFQFYREQTIVNQNTHVIGVQLVVSNNNYVSIPFNLTVPVENIGSQGFGCNQ